MILTVLRVIQGIGVGGEWGGSVLLAMEWARTQGQRGLVASWPQFGVPCGLFLVNLAVLAFSSLVWRRSSSPGAGASRSRFRSSLVGVGLWIRLGILETPVFQSWSDERHDRARADPRGDQAAAAGNHPVRAAADGGAGAVLHLHRFRLRLWHSAR